MNDPPFENFDNPSADLQTQLRREFHEALGVALARWQFVEMTLFLMFHLLLKAEFKVSSTVFFHIKSGGSKLQLVDKLVLASCQADVQNIWKQFHKMIVSWLEFRNSLAHFETTLSFSRQLNNERVWEVIMTPSHLDIGAIKDGNVKGINLFKLVEVAAIYLEGTRDLVKFCKMAFPDWRQQSITLPKLVQQLLETEIKSSTDVETRSRLTELQPWQTFSPEPTVEKMSVRRPKHVKLSSAQKRKAREVPS